MTIDLTDPIFTDENAARAHFETLRWPHGPVCPHCGSIDSATELKGKSTPAMPNVISDRFASGHPTRRLA